MGVIKGFRVVEELFDSTKHVDPRTQRIRFSHCMNCEKRIPLTNQCSLCLCFMALKTRLKSKYCELRTPEYPNGKWQKEE